MHLDAFLRFWSSNRISCIGFEKSLGGPDVTFGQVEQVGSVVFDALFDKS